VSDPKPDWWVILHVTQGPWGVPIHEETVARAVASRLCSTTYNQAAEYTAIPVYRHPPKVEAAPRVVSLDISDVRDGETVCVRGKRFVFREVIDPKPVERANAYGVVTDCATHVDRPDIPTLRDAWLVAMAKVDDAVDGFRREDGEINPDIFNEARRARRLFLDAVDGKS
jgi:hypothetical protein